jgi:hypothetical protein
LNSIHGKHCLHRGSRVGCSTSSGPGGTASACGVAQWKPQWCAARTPRNRGQQLHDQLGFRGIVVGNLRGQQGFRGIVVGFA